MNWIDVLNHFGKLYRNSVQKFWFALKSFCLNSFKCFEWICRLSEVYYDDTNDQQNDDDDDDEDDLVFPERHG